VVLGSAALVAEPDAHANGRFPFANQLDFVPAHPDTVLVRTTFGIIVSHDGGRHFNWICELIVGFVNGSDPGIALFDDGSQAVAGSKGLAITRDNECSYPFVGGDLDKQYVIDVSTEKQDPSRAVAITATQNTNGEFYTQMFRTVDNGRTWAKAGVQLPPGLSVTTIDTAPSDPNRIYVSGTAIVGERRKGFIGTSGDGGEHWTYSDVDGVTLYLSGIDPTDPLRVYARSFSPPHDILYGASDGSSLKPIFTSKGSLTGMAVSPDGSRIAVGGLQDGVWFADRVSDVANTKFEQHTQKAVSCLTWTPDHLFLCGTAEQDSFVLAKSTDEARTIEPLVARLTEIGGPPTHCPGDSPQNQQCFPDWCRQGNILCDPLRPVDPNGNLLVEGGTPAGCKLPDYCDAGAQPNGEPPAPAYNDLDCGCHVPGGQSMGLMAFFTFLSLTVATFIRRARRPR
jgi:hypothetical protein